MMTNKQPRDDSGAWSAPTQSTFADGSAFQTAVYFADAAPLDDETLFGAVYAAVSAYRREKVERYCFRKDKNLSLCAEYLLLCACRDFGISYRGQTISLGSYAKPYFSHTDVHFNISHSGEKAMCVMSRYEVGCDVEKISSYHAEVADRVFSDEEKATLLRCSTEGKRRLFYRLWTMKESLVKCIGAGLQIPLHTLSLLADGKIRDSYRYGGREYLLFAGALDGAYQYALCVQSNQERCEAIKERICVFHKTISERQCMNDEMEETRNERIIH